MREIISGNSIVFPDIFQKKKYIISLLFKIVVSAGVISFIIYKINIDEIFSSINSANYLYLFIAFFLLAPNILLQYLKWEKLCNNYLNEYEKRKIFYSLFYGFAAGLFTPARAGEYFGRKVPLSNHSLLKISAITFIDKIFSLAIISAIGIFSAISFAYYYFPKYLPQLFYILISISFFLLLLIILIKNDKPKKYFVRKINSISFFKKIINSKLFIVKIDKILFQKLLQYNLLYYFCFILQYAFLAAAFSDNHRIYDFTWAGSLLIFLKSFLPFISFGEIGIREGLSVYILSTMGELKSVGFNASLFLFLINLLFPSLAGMILILKDKKR